MWKYGLIKIDYPDLWETPDGYCELVELYEDTSGNYTSFCQAHIHSLEEFNRAHSDIQKDGINTWFSENGIFSWDSEVKFWNWKKNIQVGLKA